MYIYFEPQGEVSDLCACVRSAKLVGSMGVPVFSICCMKLAPGNANELEDKGLLFKSFLEVGTNLSSELSKHLALQPGPSNSLGGQNHVDSFALEVKQIQRPA